MKSTESYETIDWDSKLLEERLKVAEDIKEILDFFHVGGAARAIAVICHEQGAHITIISKREIITIPPDNDEWQNTERTYQIKLK